jgi:hypothetical protein
MKVVVSKHARERIRQRFNLKTPTQALAEEAWEKGKMPSPSTSFHLFLKGINAEHALCDVRRYKGFYFFFRTEGSYIVLITLYRETLPKKAKVETIKKLTKKEAFEPAPKKFLRSVGLIKSL